MKLLPFLFLLSFACYGQIDSSQVDWTTAKNRIIIDGRLVYNTGGNLIGYETGDLLTGQYHELPSLEEKLIQYADECYNDSTKYCSYLVCDNGCIEIPCDYEHPAYEYCKKKYIHREPTFSGFIQWLKKHQ